MAENEASGPMRHAYDPDLSHALLCALLMSLGGSAVIKADDFAPDALGDREGRLWGLAMEPLDSGQRIRISLAPVTPR